MKESTKKRFEARLDGLIAEGNEFLKHEFQGHMGRKSLSREIRDQIVSWQVRIKNSIRLIFGVDSAHFEYLENECPPSIVDSFELKVYIGLLDGALKDLSDGFIDGLEMLLSSDLFDSVIQEARHLNEKGYKAPSAVLGRVILERSLKKLCEKNNIDVNQKASKLNNDLKGKGLYNTSYWRQIQARLDIGNDAAHGNFDQYTKDDVDRMLDDIERFIAQYLTAD